MITGGLGVSNRPYRGKVRNAHGQSGFAEPLVERLRARIPDDVEVPVKRLDRIAVDSFEERVHGSHDIGVRIERPPREEDIPRPVLAKAANELTAAAQNSDRQSTGDGLSVGHHIRADPEIFLRPAAGESEA